MQADLQMELCCLFLRRQQATGKPHTEGLQLPFHRLRDQCPIQYKSRYSKVHAALQNTF